MRCVSVCVWRGGPPCHRTLLIDLRRAEIKRHNEAGTAPGTLVTEAEEKEAAAERVVCNNQNVVAEFTRCGGGGCVHLLRRVS